MLTAFSQKLCLGNPHICMTVIFTVKSLIDMEFFFIGNCKCFHRFSAKYSLNNNVMNFQNILCVGSSCRGHPQHFKTCENIECG